MLVARSIAQQCSCELIGVGAREWLQAERNHGAALGPGRPDDLATRPHRRDKQERSPTERAEKVLEQIEQRLIGPVDVVDAEHHRALHRTRFEHEGDRPVNCAARVDRIHLVDRRRIAHQVDEDVDHALGIFAADGREHRGCAIQGRAAHRLDRHARVEIEIVRECAGDRPPHIGLAVGYARAFKDRHIALIA